MKRGKALASSPRMMIASRGLLSLAASDNGYLPVQINQVREWVERVRRGEPHRRRKQHVGWT